MNTLLFTSFDETGQLRVPRLNIGYVFAGLILSTLVYLTALQWNAAFQLSIQNLQQKHQEISEEAASYIVASSITVFIILVTIVVYFAIRGNKKTQKL